MCGWDEELSPAAANDWASWDDSAGHSGDAEVVSLDHIQQSTTNNCDLYDYDSVLQWMMWTGHLTIES